MNHSHRDRSSRQSQQALERRRLKAAGLFARGETQAEVARQLGISREAARQWYQLWNEQGIDGLHSQGKVGRPAKLTESQKKEIEQALLDGPRAFGYATEVWTLDRITTVIRKITNVRHHRGRVWHILSAMGWSCQKPQTKAKERNVRVIRRWQKHRWAHIKKKPVK